ncbi:MAG: lipopolysaccharide heptosyltransferase II, partial [Gammaproteobacteria bacterium]|nr:lipopolysaccharide heptosyltransferase II [Gammaproteobacteria bacterium]
MQAPNKILVVGASWVGDMVMSQTLFKTIKQRHADVQLDVLAPAWSQPVLDRMPEISQSWVAPFRHGQLRLLERYRLAKKIAEQKYQQAILLPNSYKSALIPFFAKIPRRTGWLGEKRWGLLTDVRYLDKKQYPLMIQRFVALGLPSKAQVPDHIETPKLSINQDNCEQTLRRLQLFPEAGPILALCPGAEFGPSKRWPQHYYAAVAQEMLAQGWQVWLLGTQKDCAITDAINRDTDGRCINLAGKTSLGDVIDLMSLATKVITNDSGLMHIVNAVGRDTVVIYGSSSPDFTPPLSKRAQIIRPNIDCSPCFKRTCPLKHHNCMKMITP